MANNTRNFFKELAEECDILNEQTVLLLEGLGISSVEVCSVCENNMMFKKGKHMNHSFLCSKCSVVHNPCEGCSNIIHIIEDDFLHVNGKDYCPECAMNFIACEDCGDMAENPTTITLERRRRETRTLCSSCLENYFQCQDCGNWWHEDFRAVNNMSLCDDCYNESYSSCGNCGDTIHIDDSYYDENTDETLCRRCWERRDADSMDNEPPFKVQRISQDDHPFAIGMELELECRGNRNEIARHIKNYWYPLFWCKSDGSLSHDNGIEIPCQPMSWEYYVEKGEDQISEVLDHLTDEGCTAWRTSAGIHISLSKEGFTTGHTYKFLKFFYENPEYVFRISRRSKESFRKWCDCTSLDRKGLARKFREDYKRMGGDKYEAVNLNHDTHYEIRIFAGTLKKSSILANIEFCRAVYEYTEQEKVRDVSVRRFEKYVGNFQDRFSNLINLYCPHLIAI